MKRRIFRLVALAAFPLLLLWILVVQRSWQPHTFVKVPNASISSLAWSQDGRRLAVGVGAAYPTIGFRSIQIYDVKTRAVVPDFNLPHSNSDGPASSIQFTPSGKRIVGRFHGSFTSNSSNLRIWDIQSGTSRSLLQFGQAFAVLSDTHIKNGIENSKSEYTSITIVTWDVKMDRRHSYVSLAAPKGLAFTYFSSPGDKDEPNWKISQDGRRGAVAVCDFLGEDKGLLLFDASSGQHLRFFPKSKDHPYAVPHAFSPDSHTLVLSTEHRLELCDSTTGRRQLSITPQPGSYRCVFSPDGTTIAVVSDADSRVTPPSFNQVCLYDTKTGQLRRTLSGGKKSILSVAFSPDSNSLATGSDDGTVRIWRVR